MESARNKAEPWLDFVLSLSRLCLCCNGLVVNDDTRNTLLSQQNACRREERMGVIIGAASFPVPSFGMAESNRNCKIKGNVERRPF